MISFIFSFLSSVIYLWKNFSYFWLVFAILFFFYYLFERLKTEESSFKQNFFRIWPLFLVFILFLIVPQVFQWTNITSQIFIIIGYLVLYPLIIFYKRFMQSPDFFRIFSPIVFGAMAYFFFRSNLFENFFFKQLLFFLALYLYLESYRYLFELQNQNRSLIALVPAFVLLEFLWVLNFLPINFLSLAGVWLILFILANETMLLTIQNLFNFKHFLPEVIFSAILISLILTSSTWQML
ncbi:MAG: hypothetical protein N2692_00345 [Patescibacteria group bacterium]|nr:hypothetical protein [Patescibacteria group bacterium]